MADDIGCSAGCRRMARDIDHAASLGWDCLPITNRWRCPDCTRELRQVNAQAGGDPVCVVQPVVVVAPAAVVVDQAPADDPYLQTR